MGKSAAELKALIVTIIEEREIIVEKLRDLLPAPRRHACTCICIFKLKIVEFNRRAKAMTKLERG